MADIEQIRAEIAATDEQIMQLIGRRQQLAEQVGRYKAEHNEDVRNREVEQKVIARYRRLAAEQGVSGDDAEQICRLLMQEAIEREAAIPRAAAHPRHIAIVGGHGHMGQWLARFFGSEGHRVDIIDPAAGNGLTLADAAAADTVVVSVPISKVDGVLNELDRLCPPTTLIFDITSLKTPFVPTLRRLAARRPACSVHPMFGPSAASVCDRNILVCDCGHADAVRQAQTLFGNHGANLKVIPVEQHDVYMSYVLGLSHAINIAFFTVLDRSGIPSRELDTVASTTYRKMTDTNRSVALEDPFLYYEIQHLNANRDAILAEFDRSVRDVVRAASADDPAAFRALMDAGRRYFTEG